MTMPVLQPLAVRNLQIQSLLVIAAAFCRALGRVFAERHTAGIASVTLRACGKAHGTHQLPEYAPTAALQLIYLCANFQRAGQALSNGSRQGRPIALQPSVSIPPPRQILL